MTKQTESTRYLKAMRPHKRSFVVRDQMVEAESTLDGAWLKD